MTLINPQTGLPTLEEEFNFFQGWHDNSEDLDSWNVMVCRGYLPMWSRLRRRFEWLPSAPLIDQWIEWGEIG